MVTYNIKPDVVLNSFESATNKGETFKKTLGLIIGCGKLSAHIPYLLKFINQDYAFIDRELYKKLMDSKCLSEALLVLSDEHKFSSNEFDKINFYLAVKDDQIWETYQELLKFKETSATVAVEFFHFSGAKFFPKVIGIHPLMTFTEKLYSEKLYEEIPLYVDHEDFCQIHKERVKFLPAHKKPFYHAMCVMLGNFPQLLVYEVKKTLETEFDFSDFKLLLNTSVENILNAEASSALTGPLIRKDFDTISEHKRALKQTALIDLYNSFVSYFMKGAKDDRSARVAEL